MTEVMFEKASKSLGCFPGVSTVSGPPSFPSLLTFSFLPDVQQNIRTVSLLLNKAQEKHAAAQVLSQPEVRNEEGLFLKEIHEELDEEGNVICKLSLASHLSFN